MGNWKIENGKYTTRAPDVALYEFYECSVFHNDIDRTLRAL